MAAGPVPYPVPPVGVVVARGAEQRRRLEAERERLRERLASLPGVREVWVLGSLVEGHVHAASDLDTRSRAIATSAEVVAFAGGQLGRGHDR